jgi:hypothetical protein
MVGVGWSAAACVSVSRPRTYAAQPRRAGGSRGGTPNLYDIEVLMGSLVKKRRKKMSKHKYRKRLKANRHKRKK